MTKQEIIDNAPDGATHYDEHLNYYKVMYNLILMHTFFGWANVSCRPNINNKLKPLS